MIVKISVQDLRPGMRVTNPGLSQENNPHLLLVDCEITSDDQIDVIAKGGCREVFIDTEKGDYFRIHQYEKAKFENPFTVVSTDNPYEVNARTNFDAMADRLHDADSCLNALLEYSRTFAKRMAETRNIDLTRVEDFSGEIIEQTADLGDALLFLSKLKNYDDYSYTHNLNVAIISIMFGRFIGLGQDNLMILGLSGLFHDIGKVLIPAKILKKPKKLSALEFDEIKKHPLYSRDMLLGQKGVHDDVVRAAYEHHENFAGGGYPRGVSYSQIGRASSLITIVDTFDALTSERCYSKAVHAHKAMSVVFNLRGSSFAPALVDRFVKFLGVYPVGSVVALSDGTKAIVVEQNQDNLLAPKVRVVLGKNNRYMEPRDLNLMEESVAGVRLSIVECLSPGECRIKIQEYLSRRESLPKAPPSAAPARPASRVGTAWE